MNFPRKVIAHRAPSADAHCNRDGCRALLVLHIGASPLPEWETLVTQTCLAGHVQRVQGVLRYVPESWAEEPPYGV
jgi:hypothetical protein